MNKEFWLWLGEAATQLINGFFAGIGAGSASGGGAAATTDSGDISTISFHAMVGLLLGMAGNAVRRFIIWHHSHEMPNPFMKNPDAPTKAAA